MHKKNSKGYTNTVVPAVVGILCVILLYLLFYTNSSRVINKPQGKNLHADRQKTVHNHAQPVDTEPAICYNGKEPCLQKNGGKYLCCNP